MEKVLRKLENPYDLYLYMKFSFYEFVQIQTKYHVIHKILNQSILLDQILETVTLTSLSFNIVSLNVFSFYLKFLNPPFFVPRYILPCFLPHLSRLFSASFRPLHSFLSLSLFCYVSFSLFFSSISFPLLPSIFPSHSPLRGLACRLLLSSFPIVPPSILSLFVSSYLFHSSSTSLTLSYFRAIFFLLDKGKFQIWGGISKLDQKHCISFSWNS